MNKYSAMSNRRLQVNLILAVLSITSNVRVIASIVRELQSR